MPAPQAKSKRTVTTKKPVARKPVAQKPVTRKRTIRKRADERRRATRGKLKLLTAYRCLDAGAETFTGFARALNLSETGALLESPDEFAVGQTLALEFLLDNNRIVQVPGQVARVSKRDNFYQVAVDFAKLPAPTRHLLAKQIAL